MSGFQFDEPILKPLVRFVLTELLAEMERLKQIHDGRLVYSEAEAAAMLGLNPWQLRDIRRAGKISYTRIVGGRIGYTIHDLLEYLNRKRQEVKS